MGDRTSYQVTIYACPDDQRQAVLDVLNEYWLGTGWTDGDGALSELVIGDNYTAHEVSCGTSDELAAKLVETAPGAWFIGWEDPKYEWLGSVNAYTPELGLFSAECDANGIPQLGPSEIRAIIGATDTRDAVQSALDPVTVLDADQERAELAIAAVLAEIDRKTGKAWFDACRWVQS